MAKDSNQTVKQNLSSEKSKPYTKVRMLAELSEMSGMPKKQIDDLLFEHLPTIIRGHLEKDLVFTLPGLLRAYPKVIPGTPEREGKNPFTKELTVFKAKPARKSVRLKALKKFQEMAGGEVTE